MPYWVDDEGEIWTGVTYRNSEYGKQTSKQNLVFVGCARKYTGHEGEWGDPAELFPAPLTRANLLNLDAMNDYYSKWFWKI